MYPTTYLQPGSSNRSSVKKLQNYLVKGGYMTQAQMNTGPGIYGPHTTRAVSSLQQKLGVDTSGGGVGYFGPRTLKAVQGIKLNINKPSLNLNRPKLNLNRPTLNLNSQKPQTISTPTQSSVTYSTGNGQSPSINIQTTNGIRSSTGGSDKWNAFNNKQLKGVYMFASPQDAAALKNFGISPKDWNSNSVIYGKSSPFATNLLRNATNSYAKKTTSNKTTQKVVSGDTLSKIAQANNTTIGALMQANPQIKNPNLIIAGSTLNLPQTAQAATAQTPQTNIVDQTLKDFNTAIVNKDYTKLKQMGATIPVGSVTNNTPLPVTQPQSTPTTPISITAPTQTQAAPTAPATLTPEQVKAQALSGELQGLNSSLVGKEAYQTQQNTAAGVDQVQQAINDNNLAIERLNASSGQASLTAENRLASMDPITGQQAQIARQKSFKMLGLSAISDALSNNLVSAQHKANEAVQLKYGAIEEQIKADTANLALVLNSPQATLDQKKQANAMLQTNRQKANELTVNRQNQTEVFKVMTLAAQNKDNFTPTTDYPTLSTAMQAITDAKTPQEALVIAANTGMTAQSKRSSGFSLSAGQTRYDAQGNVIAQAAPKAVKSTSTSSQLKIFLNKQIATKDFQSLSAEDKKLYIRSQGADPYNFGY